MWLDEIQANGMNTADALTHQFNEWIRQMNRCELTQTQKKIRFVYVLCTAHNVIWLSYQYRN